MFSMVLLNRLAMTLVFVERNTLPNDAVQRMRNKMSAVRWKQPVSE